MKQTSILFTWLRMFHSQRIRDNEHVWIRAIIDPFGRIITQTENVLILGMLNEFLCLLTTYIGEIG